MTAKNYWNCHKFFSGQVYLVLVKSIKYLISKKLLLLLLDIIIIYNRGFITEQSLSINRGINMVVVNT